MSIKTKIFLTAIPHVCAFKMFQNKNKQKKNKQKRINNISNNFVQQNTSTHDLQH